MACKCMHARVLIEAQPSIQVFWGVSRKATESGRLKHEVEVYALPLSEEALSACCLLSFHGVTFMK